MPTKRRRTLPNASATLDPQTRQFLEAVSEIVETGEGVRGHPLDRKITLRDLIDSGIGKVIGSGSKIGNLKPGDDLGVAPPDMSTPPKPEGFFATGGFYGMISLSWSIPGELYGNHAYTNVYRSEADNFANAETIGREAGAFYTDIVRQDAIDPDDSTRLKGYYYWITFVSTAGVEGPPNDSNGTFARPLIDVGYLLDVLNGQLSESQLNKDLQARVDKIEVNETAIKQEQEVRQSGDEALSRSIDTATATLNGNITAAVREEREARVSKDDALSRQINTVQTSLGNRIGSVEETMEVQGNTIDGITAEYTLKLDVNGYIAGIGAINDGTRSQIVFRADQIAFSPPAGKGNGRAFPVVYDSSVGALVIDTAMIKDGAIQSGQLGAVQSGKLFLPDGSPVTTAAGLIRADAIQVDELKIGFGQVSGDLRSTSSASNGRPLWLLDRNGGLEMNSSAGGGSFSIRGPLATVRDSTGNLRVRMGVW